MGYTKNNTRHHLIGILALFGFALSACSPLGSPEAQLITDKASESIACEDFQSQVWNQFYRMAQERGQLVDSSLVRNQADESFNKLVSRAKSGQEKTIRQLQSEFLALYELVYERTMLKQKLNEDQLLEWLAGVELGDRTSASKAKVQEQIEHHLKRIEQLSQKAELQCPGKETEPDSNKDEAGGNEPDPEPMGSLFEYWKATLPAPVYGARKAFSTAYQSCQAMNLEPMTASTASVKGITVVGNHSSGRGLKREITSLRDVQQTHYYVYALHPAQTSCFSVKDRPLIYDFGGKPGATYSATSNLDFFRNAGTGSKELGIDCSGFVFSALASAGLKTAPKTTLKAVQVFGINARMYKNPQNNGLTCLDPIWVNKSLTLAPGDVVASTGHVVIVDQIGDDPLGLARFTDASQCELSNIDSDDFDFVIMQSSPSKNGIGINRIEASAYLRTSGTMREGFRKYALAACKAKFGQARQPQVSEISVVRHRQTPECMSQSLQLAQQECLDVCPAP